MALGPVHVLDDRHACRPPLRLMAVRLGSRRGRSPPTTRTCSGRSPVTSSRTRAAGSSAASSDAASRADGGPAAHGPGGFPLRRRRSCRHRRSTRSTAWTGRSSRSASSASRSGAASITAPRGSARAPTASPGPGTRPTPLASARRIGRRCAARGSCGTAPNAPAPRSPHRGSAGRLMMPRSLRSSGVSSNRFSSIGSGSSYSFSMPSRPACSSAANVK